MIKTVAPWWIGYLLANPLRGLVHDPAKIVGPHVREGDTVLEPGPGMGFFTLELARRVGPGGRVIAPELQEKMLGGLRSRAKGAGLLDRIDVRNAKPDSMGLDDCAGKVDFVLAFAVVHEVPDPQAFFGECARALRPGGTMLFAEPMMRMSAAEFKHELETAEAEGFDIADRPGVARCYGALLRKR